MDYTATKNFAYHGKTYYVGDAAPGDKVLIEHALVEPKKKKKDDADQSVHEG